MGVTLATRADSLQSATILACPACASRNCRATRTVEDSIYTICECRECHLVFSDPMVAANSAWYSSSWLYGVRTSHTRVEQKDQAIPWNFAQALADLRTASRGKLLDVGCAEGHFLYLAQKMDFDVTGVDFNPVSLEIARALLGVSTIYRFSVEDLANRLGEPAFNVVTIFEVLEHLANPRETVETIHGLLKPGGKLLLSVPGSRRWPALFHTEVDAPPHHLTLWTEESLQELLERAGFRVIRICKSPLRSEDLGFHLKLRLYGAVRAIRRPVRARPVRQNSDPSANGGTAPAKKIPDALRKLAMTGLTPVCKILSLNPSAGGFTLFAHCEKK